MIHLAIIQWNQYLVPEHVPLNLPRYHAICLNTPLLTTMVKTTVIVYNTPPYTRKIFLVEKLARQLSNKSPFLGKHARLYRDLSTK